MTKFTSNYPTVKTQWDLKLLYQNPSDPQIEIDLELMNQKRREFAAKYQNATDFLTDEKALLIALQDYEQLIKEISGAKPLLYFHYLTLIDSDNKVALAKLNKITQQLTKAQNQLTFFPIKLGRIDQAYQDKFLRSPQLIKYHYLLQKRFTWAKYDLSEKEEKILNLVDQTSYQMWTQGVEKALNTKQIKFQGRQVPLSEATMMLNELPLAKRRQLHTKLLTKAREVSDFAESELNAIITHKAIDDELRGFKEPPQATILGNENNPATIQMLVELVTKNFGLAHRFYRLKAKLLKLPYLKYADRAAKIDSFSRKYDFKTAYQLVAETFHQLDPSFSEILEKMATAGQIDIYPRQHKAGNAYCFSSISNPTFVLLNHTNDFNSVTTLAHEMGHAIHSQFSKTQPVIYQNYSISTAETASTFFEQFVFDRLLSDLGPEEKILALHNQIQEDVNAIFRQVTLFNFELDFHHQVKQTGFVTADQIAALLNHHLAAYLGKSVHLTKADGYSFIVWPHIRDFFYTYTYAFGQLISKSLVAQVKQQPAFINQVKIFLQAGGSASPEQIFQQIGLEVTQPQFWELGLAAIDQNISRLEKLIG